MARRLTLRPALAVAAFLGCMLWAAAPAVAQGPTAKLTSTRATQAADTARATLSAAKTTARTKNNKTTAQPKGPVAVKNVAVGTAAVPAAPKAFLAHGCLDAAHSEWLRVEVGAEAAGVGDVGAAPTPFESAPEVGALNCVPFASVRSHFNRIQSMAYLPSAGQHSALVAPAVPAAPTSGDAADLRRAMWVSRLDSSAAPTTGWHDLASVTAGQREVWLLAAALLGGEGAEQMVAEQVPARWQRDVNLLVRQMKRQVSAADTVWIRLVFSDEAETVQLLALEMVDETGRALDSAIWLERGTAPGGFVSARGGDHERLLWQAPVDYRRISRGVGATTVIVRKRVFAQPKTPGGKARVVIRSFRTRGQHQGIDFAAPTGTPVVTVADGTVAHAGKSGGYGNLVVVDHGGGVTTYYAHLSAYGTGVQEGARVERGQEIGLVGSTGMSTGPHLHYEIRKDGRYLDPADPAQILPNWGLAAEEHPAVMTRLLSLSMSRPQAFGRASRSPALAAAPAQGAAAD